MAVILIVLWGALTRHGDLLLEKPRCLVSLLRPHSVSVCSGITATVWDRDVDGGIYLVRTPSSLTIASRQIHSSRMTLPGRLEGDKRMRLIWLSPWAYSRSVRVKRWPLNLVVSRDR